MWRPSLKSIHPAWWKAVLLVAVFISGALFDNYVMPWLARDVGVWEIHGVKGEGCKGSWGATIVRFGRPMGEADGAYEIPCDEISLQSDTTGLACRCR